MLALAKWLLPLCLVVAACPSAATERDIDSQEAWEPAWQEVARLGRGFLVWESKRSGAWRIWRRELDGTGLRQISPEEQGSHHYCPHISPSGEKMVYISHPSESGLYYRPSSRVHNTVMHLVRTDGSEDEVILEHVRPYFGDRCAVWVDDQHLNFIRDDGSSQQLDLRTGLTRPLIDEGGVRFGWLVDGTGTRAAYGLPHGRLFADVDTQTRQVVPKTTLDGCQPYFTRGGDWGFWMGGPGGPIKALHFATGTEHTILSKRDPAMPGARNYLYFPMISPHRRLIAFGASKSRHNHFKSDYDIFVARLAPGELRIEGKPVRYTFHESVDRYPDVWLAAPELGSHEGEVPHTVWLDPANTLSDWSWDFGDGTTGGTASGQHRYTKPGEYLVTASLDDRHKTGIVRVREAGAPRVLSTEVRKDRFVRITFNEPIRTDQLHARLASGSPVWEHRLEPDRHTIELTLPHSLKRDDLLFLEGISDSAQVPNITESLSMPVESSAWPPKMEGLTFLWTSGRGTSGIDDDISPRVEPRSFALYNSNSAMDLRGGWFEEVRGASEQISARIRNTGAFTLIATLTPEGRTNHAAAIIAGITPRGGQNFILFQEGRSVYLRLRTARTGSSGIRVRLGRPARDRPSQITIRFDGKELTAWVNGEITRRTRSTRGALSNWNAMTLRFGNDALGDHPWRGVLEGIAIYDRALGDDDVSHNWRRYQGRLSKRPATKKTLVRVRPTACSHLPTPKEIAPYKKALAICDYRVLEVERGSCKARRIRVAHWAILDGKKIDLPQARRDWSLRMRIEPWEQHPELESIYVSSTLPEDFDVPLYYDMDRRL